jgi:hypothetical protein
MSGVTRILGSVRWFVAWSVLVFPTLAWGQEATLVQQIGELAGEVADAVAAEVEVVPFSPAIDARTTPIIVAPGEMFLTRDGGQVRGPSGPERRALLQAYAAGQTILLLHASVHDIEALHVLVEEGVTYTSTTDPVVLAYALRQEGNIPTARIVSDIRPSRPAPRYFDPEVAEQAEEEAEERALQGALDVVIGELIHPPVLAPAPPTFGGAPAGNWSQSPVQTVTLTSTDFGIYNTPVGVYALHSCQENKDYYLVNTGGDWTATGAKFQTASQKAGQLSVGGSGIMMHLQGGDQYCTAGSAIALGVDRRLCLYEAYPQNYEIDLLPPPAPPVVQVNAAPAGDQGVSPSYTSGFSFSIGGGVEISGDGPSGGIQAGATWENSTSTTVPPLLIEAGDLPNQGAFTRYRYCTVGSGPQDCHSTIQMTNPSGDICHDYVVGQPQQGQTPNGRLSNVAQTVNWQVDPKTYGSSETFDITVTWQAVITWTQAYLWDGQFFDPDNQRYANPTGQCNPVGCSCEIAFDTQVDTASFTFKVPFPSSTKCPSG